MSHHIMVPQIHGFSSLKAWLAEFPDQVDGFPSAICETGEPYVEFTYSALARPADAEIVERRVSEAMARDLARYLENRAGRIYWRARLETEENTDSVVVKYDENGPDREFVTDRKCLLDKDWTRLSCYCRLYRATHSCGEMWEWSKQQQKEKAVA